LAEVVSLAFVFLSFAGPAPSPGSGCCVLM
jgi:hypothetical protein